MGRGSLFTIGRRGVTAHCPVRASSGRSRQTSRVATAIFSASPAKNGMTQTVSAYHSPAPVTAKNQAVPSA